MRVKALLEQEEGFSRNKSFQEFSGSEGQRVIRLYRLYSSILKELETAAGRPDMEVSVRQEEGALWLTMTDHRVAYRRICSVPAELADHFRLHLSRLGLDGGQPQP